MITHINRGFVYALFLFSVLAVPSIAAEFTTNLDEFLTENPRVSVQKFDSAGVPPGKFTNCNSPVNSQSNDNCFSPGFIAPGLEIFVSQTTGPDLFALMGSNFEGEGNPPNVLVTSISGRTFDIEFPFLPARVAGFNLGCLDPLLEGSCSSQLTVQVFGDGPNVIGDTVIDVTSSFNTFLGVEYTEPIRRIVITSDDPAAAFQGTERIWFELQAVSTPIPTLSEWGMIAAAAGFVLIGAFYAVRKRKASA